MPLSKRESIYLALHHIPKGKVVTYGQLASLANLPGAARLVGSVLKNLPVESQLPWHRVINAQGRISLPVSSPGYREQVTRLTAEGVDFSNGKIKLSIYGYNP